jgi:Zn-dependent M28 family amino/carboxypeptidase
MGGPITSERLRTHIEYLAGTLGERSVRRPEALQAAADYVARVWAEQGYAVEEHVYPAAGVPCRNLEATRAGVERPQEILLLGAHYDTVAGSPGANDNGSGVAALLEIAGVFAEARPARSLRFVAFVNEEPPFFMTRAQGSMVYAREARARGDDIRLMVALETMGYYDERPGSQDYPPLFRYFHPDRGNFLGLVSDFASRHALRRLVEAFKAASDFPLEHSVAPRFVPGVAWSDHRSFWRQGYPAVMATDTAFYRYRHYHSPLDTPDKLAYPAFARATDGLARAVAALAESGV